MREHVDVRRRRTFHFARLDHEVMLIELPEAKRIPRRRFRAVACGHNFDSKVVTVWHQRYGHIVVHGAVFRGTAAVQAYRDRACLARRRDERRGGLDAPGQSEREAKKESDHPFHRRSPS